MPSEGGERIPALQRQHDVAGGEVQLQLVRRALVLQDLGQVGDVECEELQRRSRDTKGDQGLGRNCVGIRSLVGKRL